MIAKAKLRFTRGSARKIRTIIDLIKGKPVSEAKNILTAIDNRRYSKVLAKLLDSALSNMKSKGINSKDIYISKMTADNGPMWKRFRAASFGRANPILKRTSHINVELDLKK